MFLKFVIEHIFPDTLLSCLGDFKVKVLADIRELQSRVSTLEAKGEEVANKFEALRNEIAALRTVEDSAVALMKGFADLIEKAGNDENELAVIVADLRSGRQALAEAVSANTPGVIAESIPMTRPVPTAELVDPDNPRADLGTSTQTTQSIKSPDADTSKSLDGPDEPTP